MFLTLQRLREGWLWFWISGLRPLLQCVLASISGSDRLWGHSHSCKTLCNKRCSFFAPETAINIGYACNVLTDAMEAVFVITGNTALEVRQELRCVEGKGEVWEGEKTIRRSGKQRFVCRPQRFLLVRVFLQASFSLVHAHQKLGWSWHWQRVFVSGTPTFPMCCKERISSRVCCSLKLFVSNSLDDIKWWWITMSW